MKIKIFFLISAMNALSYLCFGNCCNECCKNCWDCWEECFGKEDENIKEKFFLEEKKNTGEEFKKFVNEDWLKNDENNAKFKFYEKKKEGNIKVIEYKNVEIKVENFNPENGTGKWALFEIKYKEKEGEKTVYLYCSDIESTEGKNWTYGIFKYMSGISSISVLACDTSNVTNMSSMFGSCSSLQEIKFPNNFCTSKVEQLQGMFGLCSSLESLDLSNFNTSNVTNMATMFAFCRNLTNLDLSNFDTSKIEDIEIKMLWMFRNCDNLNKVTVSNNETKTKILAQLNKGVVKWEESKDNGKIILIKKQN